MKKLPSYIFPVHLFNGSTKLSVLEISNVNLWTSDINSKFQLCASLWLLYSVKQSEKNVTHNSMLCRVISGNVKSMQSVISHHMQGTVVWSVEGGAGAPSAGGTPQLLICCCTKELGAGNGSFSLSPSKPTWRGTQQNQKSPVVFTVAVWVDAFSSFFHFFHILSSIY